MLPTLITAGQSAELPAIRRMQASIARSGRVFGLSHSLRSSAARHGPDRLARTTDAAMMPRRRFIEFLRGIVVQWLSSSFIVMEIRWSGRPRAHHRAAPSPTTEKAAHIAGWLLLGREVSSRYANITRCRASAGPSRGSDF